MMQRFSLILTFFLLVQTQNLLATEQAKYNRVNFSVTADRMVSADEISVVMSAQAIGPDIARLSDQVNSIMQDALKTANREKNIRVETLNYQTSKNYQKGKQAGWQVSQSLSLTGSDMNQLSDLIGKLQSQLQLNSISYQVSADRKKQIEAELSEQAIKDFSEKAAGYTKTLGRKNYRLVELSISNQGSPAPRPMMMARNSAVMAAEAVASPSIQPGDQKVSVSASGTIEVSE